MVFHQSAHTGKGSCGSMRLSFVCTLLINCQGESCAPVSSLGIFQLLRSGPLKCCSLLSYSQSTNLSLWRSARDSFTGIKQGYFGNSNGWWPTPLKTFRKGMENSSFLMSTYALKWCSDDVDLRSQVMQWWCRPTFSSDAVMMSSYALKWYSDDVVLRSQVM